MANNAAEQSIVHSDSLEAHSLWYRYKTAVWGRESPESATIHNTMRTFRAIRHSGPLAYISMPITSGIKYYQFQLENPEIAKNDLIKRVMDHNYTEGWHLVDAVYERRRCSVLYPADLVPARQKWQQEDFQALWLGIIAEMCTEIHMCKGWNYSNGGMEELIHAFQLKLGVPEHDRFFFYNTNGAQARERDRMRSITVFDDTGQPITIAKAIREIEKAIGWLERQYRPFSTEHHRHCLDTLLWTQKKIEVGFYQ